MTLPLGCDFLLCCAALNYAVLLAWFVAFRFAHAWMRKLHGRWFELSDTGLDGIHYAGMAAYRLGILFFNLVPRLLAGQPT